MKMLLLMITTMVLSYVSAAVAGQEDDPRVEIVGETIGYHGSINSDGATRLRELLAQAPQVTVLEIESDGGDIEAGMDIGELIHSHGLDVRVVGRICMSSCANYVFLAGRNKFIVPGALVIWHGSARQQNLWKLTDFSQFEAQKGARLNWLEKWRLKRQAKRYGKHMVVRQDGFYREIGVNGAITLFGQQVGCKCNWTLSVQDMAAFGVRHVDAVPDYPGAIPGASPFEWRLLTLRDYPDYVKSMMSSGN